jgi:hypothetical protein
VVERVDGVEDVQRGFDVDRLAVRLSGSSALPKPPSGLR